MYNLGARKNSNSLKKISKNPNSESNVYWNQKKNMYLGIVNIYRPLFYF